MKKKQRDILDAAKYMFLTYGYKDTNIHEIALKGKLSQVTLYKYYESKYSLAQAVWVDIIESGYQHFFKQQNENTYSFETLISTIITHKSELINDIHVNFYDFFLTELQNINSVVRIAYDSKKEQLYKIICDEGKKISLIDSSYSDQSIYYFFDMFVEYFRNPNINVNASLIKKEHINLLNLMLYGLFGKKPE